MNLPPHTYLPAARLHWGVIAWKDLTTLALFLGSCAILGAFGYAPLLAPLALSPRFSLVAVVILGGCFAFKVMESALISLAGHQGIPARHHHAWAAIRVAILGGLLLPFGGQGSLLGRLAACAMFWGQA